MVARLWLLFLLVFPLPSAQAQRSLCGVDLGRDTRCYSELRRLKQACQRQPTICERTYSASSLPEAQEAQSRCVQMWKTKRRDWITSLCGIPLYSPPQTFCGIKGVEVAVSCLRRALGSGASAAPSPADRSPSDPAAPSKPSEAAAPSKPSEAAAPSKPSEAAAPSSVPEGSEATAPTLGVPQSQDPVSSKAPASGTPVRRAETSPRLGQISAPRASSPSGGGLPGWFWPLQLAILGLLGWLLFQRLPSRPKARQRWAESDAWLSSVPPWQERLPSDAAPDGLLAVKEALEPWRDDFSDQLTELRLAVQNLQAKDSGAPSVLIPSRSPFAQMQEEADALFAYFCGLAHQIIQQTDLHTVSPIQKQLLQTKEKLQWIFDAHREPEQTASVVYEIREEVLQILRDLIDQTGYMSVDSVIREHLSLGENRFGAYLSRIEEEEIQRYLQGYPLTPFGEIRASYLRQIETHLLQQLETVRQMAALPTAMPLEEQQALFETAFVERFLLGSLPKQLQRLHRLSSVDRSGALIEMIADLIDEQIHQAGMLLLPPLPVNSRESIASRLQHLLQARAIYASTRVPTGELSELPPRFSTEDGPEVPSGNEQRGISSQEIPQEIALPKNHTFDQDLPALLPFDADAASSRLAPSPDPDVISFAPETHPASPTTDRDLEEAFASLVAALPHADETDEGSSFPQRLTPQARPTTDAFPTPLLGHPDSNPPPEADAPPSAPPSPSRPITDAFEQAHFAKILETRSTDEIPSPSDPHTASYGSIPPDHER